MREKKLDRATLFQSGMLMGYSQIEIRDVEFVDAQDEWGKVYRSMQFVEKGKRKTRLVPVGGNLMVEGWGHPELEVSIDDHGVEGVVMRRSKFTAFSKEWRGLLDEYLSENNLTVVFDARDVSRTEKTSRRAPAESRVVNVEMRLSSTRIKGDELESQDGMLEGLQEEVLSTRYERSASARRRCLEHYGYACNVCRISMSDVYGEIGRGFIHVHHIVPLSEIRAEYRVDPIKDLRPVCPNCHSMLHRKNPAYTVDELKMMLDPTATNPN